MINDEIDRLRLKATSSLLSRRDVIIVASVSCIYGIGSPEAYAASSVSIRKGDTDRPPRLSAGGSPKCSMRATMSSSGAARSGSGAM